MLLALLACAGSPDDAPADAAPADDSGADTDTADEAHDVGGSGESTPHYHQTSDTVDTLHMPFTTKVTGVIVATLATWATAE